MFFHVGSKTTASFAIVLVCFSSSETGDLSKKVGVSKHPGAQGHARTSHQTETNTSGLMPFWVPVLVSGRVNKFWHKQKTHAPKQDKTPQTKFCRVSQPSNPPIINNQKKKTQQQHQPGDTARNGTGWSSFPFSHFIGITYVDYQGITQTLGFFSSVFSWRKIPPKTPHNSTYNVKTPFF